MSQEYDGLSVNSLSKLKAVVSRAAQTPVLASMSITSSANNTDYYTPSPNQISFWRDYEAAVKDANKALGLLKDSAESVGKSLQLASIPSTINSFGTLTRSLQTLRDGFKIAETATKDLGTSIIIASEHAQISSMGLGSAMQGAKTATAELGSAMQGTETASKSADGVLVALFKTMYNHPIATLAVAVTALGFAFGTYLRNEALKAQEAIHEAEFERVFGGIALTADHAAAMLSIFGDGIAQASAKASEHNSAIQNLQDDYTSTRDSLDMLFSKYHEGGEMTEETANQIYNHLIDLSDNLIESISTSSSYSFSLLNGIFRKADESSQGQQQIIMNRLAMLDTDAADQIGQIQNKISDIHTEALENATDGVVTYRKDQLMELHAFAAELDEFAQIERNAALKKSELESAAIHEKIKNGQLVLNEESYKELIQQLQDLEQEKISAIESMRLDEIANLERDLELAAKTYADDQNKYDEYVFSRVTGSEAIMASLDEQAQAAYASTAATAELMIQESNLSREYAEASNILDEYVAKKKELGQTESKLSAAISDNMPEMEEYQKAFDNLTSEVAELSKELEDNALVVSKQGGAFHLLDEQVGRSSQNVIGALDELVNESKSAYETLGLELPQAFETAVNTNMDKVITASEQIKGNIIDNLDDTVLEAYHRGEDFINTYVEAMENGEDVVYNAGDTIGSVVIDGIVENENDAYDAGDAVGSVIIDGIVENEDVAYSAGNTIGSVVIDGIVENENYAYDAGDAVGSLVIEGILENEDDAFDAGETVLKGALEGCVLGIENKTPEVLEAIKNLGEKLKSAFGETMESQGESQVFYTYGQGMGLGLISGILSTVEEVIQTIADLCENIKTTIQTAFVIEGDNSEWFVETVKTMTSTFNRTIYDNMEEDITTPITDLSAEIQDNITEAFAIEGQSSGWFDDVGTVMLQSFAQSVDNNAPTVQSSFRDMFNNIGSDMEKWLNDVVTAWYDTLREIAKLSKKVGKGFSVSRPSYVSVPAFAGGGFVPGSAEIFMARENGIPEMVGRIGNRTAVANNDQIVAGISQGISGAFAPYAAQIVGAIKETGNGTQEVSFRIKGSDLVSVVDETANRQGKTITPTLKW